MARRIETLTIQTPAQPAVPETFATDGTKVLGRPAIPQGRDHGKVFILTEMPATAAERWATHATALLAKANATDVPESGGMATLAALPKNGLPALQALQDPSLDAWWDCVAYQHAPNQMPQKIIHGDGCQIEEIGTITKLRMKVLELHLGFFSPASSRITA